MRIVFVKPSMTCGVLGDAMEPLVFAILAGLTPPEIELRLDDERLGPIGFDAPADLVAISCDTYSARRTYQIAAEYRRRGVPVVVGGCHPTLMPDEALRFADAVVAGDAEDTWPAVVEDARHGRLQRLYRSRLPDLAGLRFDRSIFAGKRYGPMRLVQAGRGCGHDCDFCSVRALYGRRTRFRPPEEVAAEVEALAPSAVFFTDDNLFARPSVAIDLLRRLRPLGVRWSCQATLDAADDESLLQLMADSGCLSVVVGLESLRDASLLQMHKPRRQSSAGYASRIAKLNRKGIMVYGSFVFGYDHDTSGDFDASYDFATRNGLFLANFNPLVPMPGTPLYARLAAEGRLIRDPWWLDPEYRYGDANFQPRAMSAADLTAGVLRLRKRFNRLACIARRGLNASANIRSLYNVGTYLAVNWINRREILRKQGSPLGRPGPLAADERIARS